MTTSAVGSRLQAAARGSALVGVIARLLASMRVQPDELRREVVDDDLAALRGLFAGSILATRIETGIRGLVGAAIGSRAIRRAARWPSAIEGLEYWQRIRAVGVAGLAATATVAVSALIDPRPASGYRWWLWAVAVGVSAAAVLGARAFDAARQGSRAASRLE